MNTAKIIAVTQPTIVSHTDLANQNVYLTPEEFIVYVARISNPSNQFNMMTGPKLLKYLIEHKHWSPFEQVSVTMDIETTRDIAHQIVRHRSFSFQEFSQRYADPTKDMGFVTREARLQDHKNRQNSIETDDDKLQKEWQYAQEHIADQCQSVYNDFIKRGIAKEQVRAVLPEGLTKTRLYMSGTLRSWIHYIDVRAEEGTQKEHREIAIAAQGQILTHFPSLEDYWFPEPVSAMEVARDHFLGQTFPKCHKEPVDVREWIDEVKEIIERIAKAGPNGTYQDYVNEKKPWWKFWS